jgi:hypothetical protein
VAAPFLTHPLQAVKLLSSIDLSAPETRLLADATNVSHKPLVIF